MVERNVVEWQSRLESRLVEVAQSAKNSNDAVATSFHNSFAFASLVARTYIASTVLLSYFYSASSHNIPVARSESFCSVYG